MRVQNGFERFKFKVFIFVLVYIWFGFQSIGYSQNANPDENKKQKATQEDIIRVDTSLVTIPVTVLDREGRYVTNLKKEDFQIFENGVEQQIALFDSVEQPFTVLLLLDISGSMSFHLAELSQAANVLVNQLRPNDQLSAASFADSLYTLLKPTKISELRKSIKIKQRPGDIYTRIYDAVDDALKMMKKIRGRKAIILFSDGDGVFTSAKDNFRRAEESETLIYTVQFNTFSPSPPPHADKKIYYKAIEEANNYMRNLAQITGGRAYQIEKIADLEKTFDLIANELGRQYSLGYYPKETGKDGERRQIKVRVNVPNIALRARDSYIIESFKKNQQK
jgi:VWFA-related protein